jgi:hypothetical protein
MAANKAKSPQELQKHMAATYFTLRMGIVIIAATLPLILWLGGRLLGISLKPSMSAYYYSENVLLRDVFVGILWATGAFLYLYKGFSNRENYALNCAGILIVCVAMIPTAPPVPAGAAPAAPDPLTAHGVSAVLFFLAIAYVCIFRASDTLSLMMDPKTARDYQRAYKLLGMGMIAAPAIAYVLTLLLRNPREQNPYVFVVESVGVWIFAAYWLLKSREIAQTDAERRAVEGAAKADPGGNIVPA